MGYSIYTRRAIDRWLRKLDEPLRSRLGRFRVGMEEDGFRPSTVRCSLSHARGFLTYLSIRKKEPESARPGDLAAFLQARSRIYRQKRGHTPNHVIEWRCGYTGAIHRLLRQIQGQWPPTPTWSLRLENYKRHLLERGHDGRYVGDLCVHARQFLDYIDRRGLTLEKVQPQEVATYFSLAALRNRNKHWYWMEVHRRSVHHILRQVHGEWPPGSIPPPLLLQFKTHLQQQRFSSHAIARHVRAVRRFLDYLGARNIVPASVRLEDLYGFLDTRQKQHCQQSGHTPKDISRWRIQYTAAIGRFMRMINPHWPPAKEPANETERFRQQVCDGYVRWMSEVHGLAKRTLAHNRWEAERFFDWLGDRANAVTLRNLNVPEIDRYMAWRAPGMRRATRVGICASTRNFLRYLLAELWIDRDLSGFISGPSVYAFAEIPRAFTEEQIQTLLKTVRSDRRLAALRDYAMLMLLTTYGMRGGEVVHLRLEDIDWKENRIRVRQSKTGRESYLPLVTPVGNALLKYLRDGRPSSPAREVFLTAHAPYGPLASSSCLVSIIRRRLKQAGITVEGRHGAHAFRFARAASLLRAAVPLKQIGDLLGHQSVQATGIYYAQTPDMCSKAI